MGFTTLLFIFLGTIAAAFFLYQVLMSSDAPKEKAHRSRVLQEGASLDVATGLHDQRQLIPILSATLERASRAGQKVALFVFGIDGYELYRTRAGDGQADVVAKKTADAVRRSVRPYDPVFRSNADEISVILLSVDRSVAEKVAQRILKFVNSNLFEGGGLYADQKLSITPAYAFFPDDGDSADGLLFTARQSLCHQQMNKQSK